MHTIWIFLVFCHGKGEHFFWTNKKPVPFFGSSYELPRKTWPWPWKIHHLYDKKYISTSQWSISQPANVKFLTDPGRGAVDGSAHPSTHGSPPAIPSLGLPPSCGPSAFASQVEPRGSEEALDMEKLRKRLDTDPNGVARQLRGQVRVAGSFFAVKCW